MSMVIGTNIASLAAQRHLETSRADMETSMERLASGKRINSAMDDAAGLSVTHKLDAKITGLNQAVRNGNDGISMINVTEGALNEQASILIRLRELASQSSTGTVGSTERQTVQLEFNALRLEIDRIAATTEFISAQASGGHWLGHQRRTAGSGTAQPTAIVKSGARHRLC